MADTILKFRLGGRAGYGSITVYEGAKLLDIQEQDGSLVIWVIANPQNQPRVIEFYTALTGDEPPPWDYAKTVQLDGGKFVLHVFLKNI